VKLFNIGLTLMIAAIIVLPIIVIVSPSDRDLVLYAFYFCGLLELIGLTFVLIHMLTLKRKSQ